VAKQLRSYHLAETVAQALEKRIGVALSTREVFTTDGAYPTACVCELTPGCTGCFPSEAFDEDGNMRPEYRDLRPGDWCRYRPSSLGSFWRAYYIRKLLT